MSTEPQDTQILVRPEVTAFVEEMRRELADLDDETRDELVGGLEADLSDQLADGAPLGDPGAYAAELRAAAGLPEARRRTLPSVPDLRAPGALIDRSRARFLALVERPRLAPACEVAAALRPAWWVARAWVAVTTLDAFTGPWEQITLIPTLGAPLVGEAVLATAVVVSALIGLDRLWPGSGPDRPTASRIALLILNAGALLAPALWNAPWPGAIVDDDWVAYDRGYRDGSRAVDDDGLRLDGNPIHNIYAYDATGKPIDRVQLFDEKGDPIEIGPSDGVTGRRADRTVGCPARNGDVAVYNVFPLDQLTLRRGTCADVDDPDAVRSDHPLASVPPINSVPSSHDQPADPRRTPGPDRRP
jgi:hypothetical protein